MPPPDIAGSRWCKALPLREQKGLHVHITAQPSIATVETSQSISHMTWTTTELIGTLTPRNRLVLRAPFVQTPRVASGVEKLAIAGIPEALAFQFMTDEKTGTTDMHTLLSGLAGNAFQAEILAAFVIAIICNLTDEHIAFAQRHHLGSNIPAT